VTKEEFRSYPIGTAFILISDNSNLFFRNGYKKGDIVRRDLYDHRGRETVWVSKENCRAIGIWPYRLKLYDIGWWEIWGDI
jgi:hypothetical protein